MAWYDVFKDAGEWLWDHSTPGYYQDAADKVVDLAKEYGKKLTDKAGLTNVEEQEEAYEEAEESLKEQQKATSQTYGQAQDILGRTRNIISKFIGPMNVVDYKKAVSTMDPGKYGVSPEDLKGFEFERDVSKYIDPAAKYQIDQSVQAALQAMSGQGGITGGAAARALQAEASQKASELYGDAWERMMKSTEQEYGKEKDILSAEQKAAEQKLGAEEFRTKELGNLFGSYIGNLQGYNEDVIRLLMAQMGTNLSLSQAMAQLGIDKASQPTWLQQLLGTGGQAAGIVNLFK